MQNALTAVILSLTVVLSVMTPFAVASPATVDSLVALGLGDGESSADDGIRTLPDPSEPNDDFDTATPIALDTPTEGRLDPSEADVYSFTGEAGTAVTVTITRTTTAGAVAIVLYGPDRDQLTFEFVGTDVPASMSAVPTQSGTHYVQVVDLGSAAGTYSLQVGGGAVDPPDGEPNDSPDQATDLPRGSTLQGEITSATDQDWYRITTDGTMIQLPVTRAASGSGQFVVQFHTAAGQPASDPFPVGPGGQVNLQGSPPAGTYFVSVRSADGGLGAYEIEYVGASGPNPDNDPNEPNDSPAQATPLARGDTAAGAIESATDQDWFRILTDGTAIQIPVTRAESGSGQLVVQFHTAAGQPASDPFPANPGGQVNLQGSPPAGTYLVSVRSANGGLGAYEIEYVGGSNGPGPVTPGNDPNEPNDAPDEASSLGIGQTVAGTIDPSSDEDWFTFQSPGGQTLPIELARIGGFGTFNFQLYNGGEPASPAFTTGPNQDTRITGTPSAGAWSIRIWSPDGGTGAYVLRLEGSAPNTDSVVILAPIYEDYAVQSVTTTVELAVEDQSSDDESAGTDESPEADESSDDGGSADESDDGQYTEESSDDGSDGGEYREEPSDDGESTDGPSADEESSDDESDSGEYREESSDDGQSTDDAQSDDDAADDGQSTDDPSDEESVDTDQEGTAE